MSFVNTRVPMQQAEFDTKFASQGPGALNYKGLIIGQGTDAGSASANTLELISSAIQAAEKFGTGSMIHRMALKFFNNNTVTEMKAIAASMDPVATPTNKATGSVQFTAAATGSGTYVVYVAGERIAVSVASGDTVANLSAKLKAEIDASHPNLPVKSTDDTIDTVDFEALNIGVTGNDIDIREYAKEGDEDTKPAGVTTTITAMSTGASDPALTSLIAALADEWFQIWISPYNDTTNYAAVQAELERRFGPTTKIDGLSFQSKRETYANLITFGAAKNTEQISNMGAYNSMTTPYEWAAAIAGQVAQQLAGGDGNEALPFQTLELKGVEAPPIANRFTFTEKTALLNNGISTFEVDSAGKVRIGRLITQYLKTAGGSPDTAWLDVNTRFTAMYIRWDWIRRIETKFGQAKLAGDGNRIGPRQVVLTPKVGKAEAVAAFLDWEVLGLVEDFNAFKSSVIAAIDGTDPNKFNWQIFPDLVNQFRNGETTISFIL